MKSSKFILSTLIAAAAMTSTAWAEDLKDLTVDANGKEVITGEESYDRVTNNGTIYVESTTFSFDEMVGNDAGTAQLFINGESTIRGTSITGDTQLRIGQYDNDRDGKKDDDLNGTGTNIVTFDVANISATFANAYNTELIFTKDTTIRMTGVYGNGYFYMDGATLDMGGHTVTMEGMITATADFKNGKFVFDGTAGEEGCANFCIQDSSISDTANVASSIAADATVEIKTAGQVTIYEDFNVYGTFIDKSDAGNATLIGLAAKDEVTEDFNGTALVISGKTASWTQANRGMTIYGATDKNGNSASSVTVTDGAKMELTKGRLINNSALNVSNATFTAAAVSNNAGATITVADSTFKAGTVTNSGTFNVTGESTVKFDKLTMAGNTNFVGDSTDAAGTHKVTIGSYTDGATAQITGDGSTRMYFYGADVTLASDVSATMGNEQFFYFKNSKLDLNGKKLTLVSGKFLTNNLTIDGTGYIVIGGTVNTDMPCWQGNENVIGENVTITSYEQQNFYGNVTIYGTVITDQWSGTDGNGSDLVGTTASGFEESVNAKLTVSGEKASYTIKSGPGFAVSTATNTMVVENGALFDMQSGAFDNKGTVEVNNATFKAVKFVNKNAMSVNGSTFNAGTVDNDGRFNIAGESTLNVGTFTGGNAIYAADGAVIKDSTIGGATVFANGDLTFKGDNTIGVLNPGWYNNTITIGVGDSLKTTGSRSTFSYGNTIDVDGEIAEAKAVTDKTQLTKSLELVGGWSLAGNGTANGKNATLDVDNAYVSFGSTTSKNSSATGTFVMDFNNSIVDFTNDFQTAASTVDGLDPHFYLNATDSVVSVGTRFAFNHANSTAVIDNSSFVIAQQFKNAGTFTLQNGSEMTVGSNADGPSYEKTGNFGTLNVNSGSIFDMTTSATAAYPFYNVGTVNVNEGTFKAGVVSNNGTIAIDNGTVDVAGTFYNYKTTSLNGATVTVANLYNRPGSTMTLDNDSTLKITSYANQKGDLIVAGASTVDASGIDMYVYDNNNDDIVEISLSEGSDMTVADLTIGGKDSLTPNGNAKLTVDGSSLNATTRLLFAGIGEVYDNGTLQYTSTSVSGDIKNSATVTAKELVLGTGASLSVADSTLTAGSVTNSGTITFSGNSTLESGVLNGKVTIESGATLTVASSSLLANVINKEDFTNKGTIVYKKIEESVTITIVGESNSKSVSLSGTESSVKLTAAAGTTVTFSEASEIATTDVKIPEGSDAKCVLAAWSFVVTKPLSGSEYVTVEMDVEKGLSADEIRILHKGDKATEWTDVTKDTNTIGSVSYNAETGKLTFNAKSFSSYAAANVPEPSAFGLLAGLGALALVAARRRRRK